MKVKRGRLGCRPYSRVLRIKSVVRNRKQENAVAYEREVKRLREKFVVIRAVDRTVAEHEIGEASIGGLQKVSVAIHEERNGERESTKRH